MNIFLVGLILENGILCDTLQYPMPLEWVKRCWKDGRARCFCLCMFLNLFFKGGFFFGGILQGLGKDMEELGGKQY